MLETQSETQNPRNQCRHIHTTGHRCGSPTLRQEPFCYFHHTSRSPIAQSQLEYRRGHQSIFGIPSLEDRASIQLALTEILHRIATHNLDPRRAGLLLYGLQIAAGNLPKPTAQPTETVDEILYDETHGPLAPEQQYQTAPKEKGLEQILHEQWLKDAEDAAARLAEDEAREALETQGVPHDHRSEAKVIVGGSTLNTPNLLQIQAVATQSSQPPSRSRARLQPCRNTPTQTPASAAEGQPSPTPRSNPNPHRLNILHAVHQGHPHRHTPHDNHPFGSSDHGPPHKRYGRSQATGVSFVQPPRLTVDTVGFVPGD